jgi:sec-independent protein translocase protein TatA
VPLSPLEIALIVLVLVLFFLPKRIPDVGRSLGRGMREFKDAIAGSDADEQDSPEPSERIDLSSTAAPQSEAAAETPKKPERVSS